MINHTLRALATAIAIALCCATGALAAGALKGKTYRGEITRTRDTITLKVSRDGRHVTVNIPHLPAYCSSGGPLEVQVTKPAEISRGRFTSKIGYFYKGHRSFGATITGTFVKKKVNGVVRSEYGPNAGSCNGSSPFSAVS